MTAEKPAGRDGGSHEPEARRRYEPPAIEWEEEYGETFGMASACNKVTISEAGCDTGISS
jgi:hypothetical protein